MGIVKQMATNGNMKHNTELERAAKRVAFACTQDVVSRALYDDLLKQQAAARLVLERYGLRHASIVEGLDALGRFAVSKGWNSQADLDEYQQWLDTVDDATGRM